MTRLIDKLVDMDMVARQTGATDRRKTNIVLTARGKSTLQEQEIGIRRAFQETLDSLTDKDVAEISASLRKLREIFSKTL